MTKSRIAEGAQAVTGDAAKHEPAAGAHPMPAVVPPAPSPAPKRRRYGWLVLLALLIAGGAGGGYWWTHRAPGLPPGIALGNGRLEADEIDIETKFPGRIAELMADEGDMVKAGQVVARMDTQDLQASLAKAEAGIVQAQRAVDAARADVAQQRSQAHLAQQQLQRSQALVARDFVSKEVVDQRQSQLDVTTAGQNAAQARVAQSEQALEAARQDAALIRVNIADNRLVVPRDGRIQYRLANVGEVLGAGGKVFTLLDTSYVYMDIFLPTSDAGGIKLGSDAVITLDARPGLVLPAKVAFVASQAQFTPKSVETKSERDKLMFRVRVKIDPDLLRAHADQVRSGLPGVAYVRTQPDIAWPEALRPTVSK